MFDRGIKIEIMYTFVYTVYYTVLNYSNNKVTNITVTFAVLDAGQTF